MPEKSAPDTPDEAKKKVWSELIVRPILQEASKDPDEYTRKDNIFIDGGAPNQVFRLQLWGFSYGTDDKTHAASILLSILTGCLLVLLFLIGAVAERAWLSDALSVLGTVFTLTIGVAIGKSSNKPKQ